jgi:hypothetical protein
MHRAAKRYPPEDFRLFELSGRVTVANTATLGFQGKSWKCAAALFSALLLGVSASPAFAQRSGGGHGGGGSRSSGAGSFHSSGAQIGGGSRSANEGSRLTVVSGPPSSAALRSTWVDPPATRLGVQSETDIGNSSGAVVKTPTSRSVSTEGSRISDRTSPIDPAAYPKDVTIGFPRQSSRDLNFSATSLHPGVVVSGQSGRLWTSESVPERVGPRPGLSVSGLRSAELAGSLKGSARPRSARDIGDRRVLDPLHVFGPRHRRHPHPPFLGGFGFFGSGFGAPFFGLDLFSDCVPFWDGTLPLNCDTFGYWNGYGAGLGFGYDQDYDTGGQGQPDDQQGPDQSQDWDSNVYEAPPAASTTAQTNPAAPLSVLWLKNGTSYAVTDYWLAGEKLHYVTSYGGENAIGIDQLDLQKTVDANADRGLAFILRPAPPDGPSNPQQQQH